MVEGDSLSGYAYMFASVYVYVSVFLRFAMLYVVLPTFRCRTPRLGIACWDRSVFPFLQPHVEILTVGCPLRFVLYSGYDLDPLKCMLGQHNYQLGEDSDFMLSRFVDTRMINDRVSMCIHRSWERAGKHFRFWVTNVIS